MTSPASSRSRFKRCSITVRLILDQRADSAVASDTRRKYLLRVSYLEIYNEQLKDLLGDRSAKPAKLEIRETSGRMEVSGAYEEIVSSPIEVIEALQRGENSRHVGATDWNHRSSRSHCVFTLTIESCEVSPESTASLSSVASGPIGRSRSRAGGRSHRVSQLVRCHLQRLR